MKDILIAFAAVFAVCLLVSYIEFKIYKKREPIIGMILVAAGLFALTFFGNDTHWFWCLLGFLFTLIPVFIARFLVHKEYQAYTERERQKQVMLQNRAIYQAYMEKRNELISKYGEPTRSIQLRENDFNSDIDVFEGRQIIKVGPDYIPFTNVKGHSIYSDTEIRKGRQYLHGTASGTISGASFGGHNSYGQWNTMSGHYSGNFNGTIDSDNDHVQENMTLCLSTGDMRNPVIYFELGSDKRIVKEVDEILKIIENRNNQISHEETAKIQ